MGFIKNFKQEEINMKGWKTYTGAAFLALGSIMPVLGISVEIADAIQKLGEALIATGIGHKLDKKL
jgi:hypothetical protein